MEWAPNPVTSVFIRRHVKAQRHTRKRVMKQQAETGRTGQGFVPRVSGNHWKLRRSKERHFLRYFRGNMALPKSSFWTSSFQNC